MSAFDIIYDYLQEADGLTPEMESLIKWIGDDDLVHWFFHSWFANDVHELRVYLGKEKADIIEDYYDTHCRRD